MEEVGGGENEGEQRVRMPEFKSNNLSELELSEVETFLRNDV